jgi:microcystin-dependent protein
MFNLATFDHPRVAYLHYDHLLFPSRFASRFPTLDDRNWCNCMPFKSIPASLFIAATFILSAPRQAHPATTGTTGGGQPIGNLQPSLALNYLIRLDGVPGQVGEVIPFPGAVAPAGYAFPQGQLLPIDQFPNLFGQIGVTYGGDGATTFALPDLRGRTPIHSGHGVGLTSRPLGTSVGVEATTLTYNTLPYHKHGTGGGGFTDAAGLTLPFSNMQPSLAMNYAVALNANAPSSAFDNPPTWTGQVRLFAGAFTPNGYAPAEGQLLSANSAVLLFQQLGFTYGGDGSTTFALPDLRGRTVIHQGSADGVNMHALGAMVGAEATTLSASQLPAHTHSLPAPAPAGATLAAGDGQPFDNMQPSLALNYIICIDGNVAGTGGAEEPFIGEIALIAGNTAPKHWDFANGQLLPIASNGVLFSILGDAYGGNGTSTFALPDLRGRAIVGAGLGPNLTDRVLGQSYGEENTEISIDQLPPHYHNYPAFNGDYTDNGFVDGADLLNWQRGFPTPYPATHRQGDGDFEGNVNSFDLAIWSAQFGAAPPPPVAPVPEPAAYLLATVAACSVWIRRIRSVSS